MGIASALERVKRQAKQGGLQGVITGLGRELRSEQIPVPLRAAAQRIASLLPFEQGARFGDEKSEVRAVTHADDLVVAARVAPLANDTSAQLSAADDPAPRDRASSTGSDAGVEPGAVEPEVGTPVDPAAVGATPDVIATPTEVEPVDASPTDVRGTDATPSEVAQGTANPILTQLVPDDVAQGEESEPSVAAVSEKTEVELAPSGEAAKNLARSGSRSKKRSRSKGTSKKK